jgi:hypothetical protein
MVLGSAPPTMAIAVGVSPTRTIAPVYKVRAADFITHDAADDGTDRSRDDGSDARTDADAFDFASLGGKRRSKQCSYDESNEPGGAHGSSAFLVRMIRQRTAAPRCSLRLTRRIPQLHHGCTHYALAADEALRLNMGKRPTLTVAAFGDRQRPARELW